MRTGMEGIKDYITKHTPCYTLFAQKFDSNTIDSCLRAKR